MSTIVWWLFPPPPRLPGQPSWEVEEGLEGPTLGKPGRPAGAALPRELGHTWGPKGLLLLGQLRAWRSSGGERLHRRQGQGQGAGVLQRTLGNRLLKSNSPGRKKKTKLTQRHPLLQRAPGRHPELRGRTQEVLVSSGTPSNGGSHLPYS